MLLIFTVIFVALVFTFINGFHDTANSIATVVATKVLSPRQAVLLAAVTNLIGGFFGLNVAKTISSGIVDAKVATSQVLLCALFAAILWNLLTWWFGMPSSSSHALIGSLCGASVAAAQNNWHVLIWSVPAGGHWWKYGGIFWKVIVPMISSPVCGFFLGFLVMAILYFLLRNWRPVRVNKTFGVLQLFSSGYMGFAHGTNDATKTMGIIALALFTGTTSGAFAHLPAWLNFLQTPPPEAGQQLYIAKWIIVVCSLTMCLGTAVGGWRIIKTLGHKMVKIHPVHGFAAETTSATILFTTALLGMPVSTTHAVTASIMGVGCAKSPNALRLIVVERILWAWIMTLPISGGVAYAFVKIAQTAGWM
ncbi:MAG TPA: inorganic phosphate transporter [Verrucomicrobiae bacterium]|nr:inorganic phosphate transporter [Verrucomicrobiae bacterium]